MSNDKYSRYEFLKTIGFKGSALMAVLGSCTTKSDSVLNSLIVNNKGEIVAGLDSLKAAPIPVLPSYNPAGGSSGITSGSGSGATTNLSGIVTTTELNTITNFIVKVDLTGTSASTLKNQGGFMIANGTVVIASLGSGQFVAAQNLCTHQPRQRIIFNQNEFYCTDHGARFTINGQGLNSLGSRGLNIYRTANDGKTLVVFS